MEINPEYSLEGLMLKIQYFGHLMWRAHSLEKTLMLGKIEGRRRTGWQRIRCLDGILDSVDMSWSKLWEMVKDREAWRAAVHGSRIQLSDWTTKGVMRGAISERMFSIGDLCEEVKGVEESLLWGLAEEPTRQKGKQGQNINRTLIHLGWSKRVVGSEVGAEGQIS